MKYDILTADVDDYLKLRSSVRRSIKKGWEPLGGVSAYKDESGDTINPAGRIFQAMIKKEKKS